MTLRTLPFWLLGWVLATLLVVVWRLDVLTQRPYGSAAMGLFAQASAIAFPGDEVPGTPAPSLNRFSIGPYLLAGAIRVIPSGTPLMVATRVASFALHAAAGLFMVWYLRPRCGWAGSILAGALVLTAPIWTVQMELIGLDSFFLPVVWIAVVLLMSGWGWGAAIAGLVACCLKWTAISYLVAGGLYLLARRMIVGRSVSVSSMLAHFGFAVLVAGVMIFQWDASAFMGGWVPDGAFGTSPLVDLWRWAPDLLVLMALLIVVSSAVGGRAGRAEVPTSGPETGDAEGLSLFDPPLLLGGLMLLCVAGRLGWSGATPAEVAMIVPSLGAALAWTVYSLRALRPFGALALFAVIAFQLVNSTGLFLPPYPQSIDFRTGALRERSREYLATDQAYVVQGINALIEKGRESPVAAPAPITHYLSLPALGYVTEPFRGYSLGGPSAPGFPSIEKLRDETPSDLAVFYLRNRYGANHDWTIPPPDRGDEVLFPRNKKTFEEDNYKISPVFVYKPRQVPSETAEEKNRRYQRRFWPATEIMAKASQLLEMGQMQEAEIALRQLLQIAPSNHEARIQLGMLLERRGDFATAQEEYNRVPIGTEEYWQAMSQWAAIETNKGNVEGAEKAFADAIASYRSSPKPDPRVLATLYVRSSVGDLSQKNWSRAEEKLRQATATDPGFGVAFRELGLVLLNQGKDAEARDQLELAIDLDREDALAHFYLASTMARLKDFERARVEFTETLRIEPENLNAQQSLAETLLKLGRFAEAQQEYEDALARVPEAEKNRRALLMMGLGDAQRGKGDWAGAIVTLRRAVDVEEGTHEAANHLAWLLSTAPNDEWRNGEEAVQLLERVADDPAASSVYLDTLAAAYAETGAWEKAVALANRAIEQGKKENLELVAEFENRRSLYERKEPYRDESLK